MNPNSSVPLEPRVVAPLAPSHVGAAAPSRQARAELAQRSGKRMILAGAAITVAGVVVYCAACFAGDMSADFGDMVLRNAVPFARGALVVLGIGTLMWMVGSFTYLRGVMDAEEPTRGDG